MVLQICIVLSISRPTDGHARLKTAAAIPPKLFPPQSLITPIDNAPFPVSACQSTIQPQNVHPSRLSSVRRSPICAKLVSLLLREAPDCIPWILTADFHHVDTARHQWFHVWQVYPICITSPSDQTTRRLCMLVKCLRQRCLQKPVCKGQGGGENFSIWPSTWCRIIRHDAEQFNKYAPYAKV